MTVFERFGVVAAEIVLFTLAGASALVLGRLVRSWLELGQRVLLAPAVGAALCGIVVTIAGTVGVAVGPLQLAATTLVGVGFAGRQLGRPPRPARPRVRSAVSVAIGASLVALLAYEASILARTPIFAYDGLVTWAFKAAVLLEGGTPDSPVWDPTLYGGTHPEYPLLFPDLQATALRIAGGYDEPLLRLNALALTTTWLLGLLGALRGRAQGWLSGSAIAAVVANPLVLQNLGAGDADVHVGLLLALALVLWARWLEDGARWQSTGATLFAAAAVLTKNEGLLGVIAIWSALALALVVAGQRVRLAGPARALAVVAAAYAPWRIFRSVHGLGDPDFDLTRIADPSFLAHRADRIQGTLLTIARQMIGTSGWPLLAAAALIAVVALIHGRNRTLLAYGLAWGAVLVVGMVLAYLLTALGTGARLRMNVERTTLQLAFGLVLVAVLAVGRRTGQAP